MGSEPIPQPSSQIGPGERCGVGALRGQALGARSSSDLGLKAWICSGSAPSNPVAEPAGGAGFPGGSNFTRGARCEVFSGESRSLPALVAR